MSFGTISVENIQGGFLWHIKCSSCQRTTRTNDDLSERMETVCQCFHCKEKIQLFSSFSVAFKKFFPPLDSFPEQQKLLPYHA